MRLIDADNIKYTRLLSQQGLDMELVAKVAIDNMPTVDAEPVRHGRWGKFEAFPLMPSLNGFPCSVCSLHVREKIGLYYCPNCGAKMDEEVQR